jgi:hypothetical protein
MFPKRSHTDSLFAIAFTSAEMLRVYAGPVVLIGVCPVSHGSYICAPKNLRDAGPIIVGSSWIEIQRSLHRASIQSEYTATVVDVGRSIIV